MEGDIIMKRVLIKWLGCHGRRHKIRMEKIIQWSHDNGIGA